MNNKQVAHLWANKSRKSASGSHFYFEGDTIYSYGSHFPIARHYDGVVLFTTQGYSSTTACHKSIVREACSHLEVFHVDDVTKDPSKADLKSYKASISLCALKAAKARNPEFLLESLQSIVNQANAFCEHFGFSTRFTMPSNLDDLKAKAAAQSVKDRAAKAARLEKIEKDNTETVRQWLSGASVSIPCSIQGVYLRYREIDGPKMETSKGAIVLLSEAKKAFRFVMLKRENGWHRNGEQFPIGEFHLDAVNEQGVVAGCHRVAWGEIERFAKTQNWILPVS